MNAKRAGGEYVLERALGTGGYLDYAIGPRTPRMRGRRFIRLRFEIALQPCQRLQFARKRGEVGFARRRSGDGMRCRRNRQALCAKVIDLKTGQKRSTGIRGIN